MALRGPGPHPSLWCSGDILSAEVYRKNNYCFGLHLPPAGCTLLILDPEGEERRKEIFIELGTLPGAFKYLITSPQSLYRWENYISEGSVNGSESQSWSVAKPGHLLESRQLQSISLTWLFFLICKEFQRRKLLHVCFHLVFLHSPEARQGGCLGTRVPLASSVFTEGSDSTTQSSDC